MDRDEGQPPTSAGPVDGQQLLEPDAPVVVPRPAAAIVLVRGGSENVEVLMLRRTPKARFMAGVWVFPGGAVDAADGSGEAGARAAAIRELAEEAAVTLEPSAELIALSRWITPAGLPIRFDTSFFLAAAPAACTPAVDGSEIVDWRWIAPADAIAEADDDGFVVAFPTMADLRGMAVHPTADALIAHARAHPPAPTQPVITMTDGGPRVRIPGRDAS